MTHSDVPLLLLLLGTSTIFNVVTAQGEYPKVLIAGINIMLHILKLWWVKFWRMHH